MTKGRIVISLFPNCRATKPVTDSRYDVISSIFAGGYNYDGGPESWNVNYPNCRGNKQSPINFNTNTDRPSPLTSGFFRIYNTDNFTVSNSHGIEFTDLLRRSAITFDFVTYDFQQVHFHIPSEHRIDGKHYDAEAHFVFKDRNNNLSVIGVLYSVNAGGFSKFLSSFPYPPKDITWTFGRLPDVMTADLLSVIFSIAEFGTTSPWAYRYYGSLTTPPCNEGVTWWVATKILPISVDQLISIRALTGYNSRPTQPRNGRTVPGYY
ncbi:hypothetical protein RclHR1_11920003 [Rhizophagus clarus]|uniref:Carbonic anhydrase n=1 Tax=Rhizophagus clarus TaxID=94130 RepID=A0A2Z6QAB0_9GLOM|nr:hypothetical protein RclHR1_11920003 [Rhizophagus clarus]